MILHNYLPYERFYESGHMEQVQVDLRTGFDRYMLRFCNSSEILRSRYQKTLDAYEKDQEIYKELLDPDVLEEFEDDPSAFKGEFQRKYPIIRHSLQSRAPGMEKYKASFFSTTGQAMLDVVCKIVYFAQQYRREMTDDQYEAITYVEGFGLTDLDADGEAKGPPGDYTVPGVIGGGIRSHLLYHLHPNFFPNRSQNAIWALYFLTDCKKYGFEDDSEFLMINDDGSGTQQNFFYPYDLFTYYALQLYHWLKPASEIQGYYPATRQRYVYVDSFLSYVAECHQAHIDALRPIHAYRNY